MNLISANNSALKVYCYYIKLHSYIQPVTAHKIDTPQLLV